MARPNLAPILHDDETGFQAGGPVAALHKAIEARVLNGQAPIPEWSEFSEALSPTEQAMHNLSRTIGIAALAAGFIAAASLIAVTL